MVNTGQTMTEQCGVTGVSGASRPVPRGAKDDRVRRVDDRCRQQTVTAWKADRHARIVHRLRCRRTPTPAK
jgi:hypothetical protein